jgi:hypothetical protein
LKEYQESFIDAENNPDVTAGGVSNANVNASALILDVDDGAVPSDVGAEPYDLIVGEDETSIEELFETHVVPSSPGNAIRFSDSRKRELDGSWRQESLGLNGVKRPWTGVTAYLDAASSTQSKTMVTIESLTKAD